MGSGERPEPEPGRPELAPGSALLDLYEVGDPLDEGRAWQVHRARHRQWNADVTVIVPRDAGAGVDELRRRALAWSELRPHSFALTCRWVHVVEERPLLFADPVEATLADWIRSGRLYEAEESARLGSVVDIATQVAWGADHLRSQGWNQGELTPAGIFLDRNGRPRVRGFDMEPDGLKARTLQRFARAARPRAEVSSWASSVLQMLVGETWSSGTPGVEWIDRAPDTFRVPPPPRLLELLARCLGWSGRPPRNLTAAADALRRPLGRLVTPGPSAAPLDDPASRNNRAVTLYSLGDRDAADRLWAELLEKDPLHTEARFNATLSAWRRGLCTDEDAVRALEAFENEAGGSAESAHALGLIHLERRDGEAAGRAFREAADRRGGPLAPPSIPDEPFSLEQHPGLGSARAVALSGDGSRLLTAEGDLLVLRGADLEAEAELSGHTKPVTALAMTPDARFALSGSEDRTLRFWDVAERRCVRMLASGAGRLVSVALSGDGRWALSAALDRAAEDQRNARAERAKQAQRLAGARERERGVPLVRPRPQPMGSMLRPLPEAHVVHLWDLSSGKSWGLESGIDAANEVAIDADGRFGLTAGTAVPHSGGEVAARLWDLRRRTATDLGSEVHGAIAGSPPRAVVGKRVVDALSARTLWQGPFELEAVALRADGGRALCVGLDGSLSLWDTASGRCLRTARAPEWGRGAHLSADGRLGVVKTYDGVRLVRIGDDWRPRSLPLPSRPAATAPSATESAALRARLQSAMSEGRYTEALSLLSELRAHPGAARDPENVEAWAALYRRCTRVRLRAVWTLREMELPGGAIVRLSPDGSRIACLIPTSSWERSAVISLQDTVSGRTLLTLPGKPDRPSALAFSADGGMLAVGAWRSVWVWDTSTGAVVREQASIRHFAEVSDLRIDPRGRYALHSSLQSRFKLWDLQTGRGLGLDELSQWFRFGGLDMAPWFTAEGRWGLDLSREGRLELVDRLSSSPTRLLVTGGVESASLSSDGRFLLTVEKGETYGTSHARLRQLDWELQAHDPSGFDPAARPFLKLFLRRIAPVTWPASDPPTAAEWKALLEPDYGFHWSEASLEGLLLQLASAGWGWIRPEAVVQELRALQDGD